MNAFSSWLLLIDNVVELEDVRRFWPASGSKDYGCGQILVTTQDSSTIPENGSHSHCIFLSRGMDPPDAVSQLTKVSRIPNQENVEDVAKALDYQPLALACAACYVYSVRSRGSPHFNREKYLDKLKCGKEEAMGEIKRKCDSGYTKSMPVAVRMAVEREVAIMMKSYFILFNFFKFCIGIQPGKEREVISAALAPIRSPKIDDSHGGR